MRLVIGRAAMLCKADLLCGVVGEFPDLQGIMGGIYARLGGEAEAVALAMEEHYRPTASGGALPSSKAGLIISMADKLDTIAGFFAIGKIPTGTVDPYALRRQAIGVINMLLASEVNIPLDEAVESALANLTAKIRGDKDKDEIKTAILDFFSERLRQQLLGEGLAFDSIDAVLATKWYNISDSAKRVRALEAFKSNDACSVLALLFKRVSNILKGFTCDGRLPDKSLFSEEAEIKLMNAAEGLAPKIEKLWKAGDYNMLFETLASMRDEINGFFDDVMVMADDESIKQNRLQLLAYVRALYVKIADISRLNV
jgi:glycyl-tRNA synthetase beta chain